jgi:hypothetical protein
MMPLFTGSIDVRGGIRGPEQIDQTGNGPGSAVKAANETPF